MREHPDYANMETRNISGEPQARHPFQFAQGARVIATAGPKDGQTGRILVPGYETAWVKWGPNNSTTYPHRSLALVMA